MSNESDCITLWHYTTVEAAKSILSSMKFRIFHFSDMEDALEVKYPLRLFQIYMKKQEHHDFLGWKSDFIKFMNSNDFNLYLWCFSTSSNYESVIKNIRNFRKTNNWRSWVGLCFKIKPDDFSKTSNEYRWSNFCMYDKEKILERFQPFEQTMLNYFQNAKAYKDLEYLFRIGTNVDLAQMIYPIKRGSRRNEHEFRVAYILHSEPLIQEKRRYFEVSIEPIKQNISSIVVGGENSNQNIFDLNQIASENELNAEITPYTK